MGAHSTRVIGGLNEIVHCTGSGECHYDAHVNLMSVR